MRQLAQEIDNFLNEVILRSENQHEILIGHCLDQYSGTHPHALVRRIPNQLGVGPSP